MKVVIVVVGLVICFMNIRSMTLIETESENASVLKESNPLEKVLVWQHKEIWREDKLDLSFVYGIKPYL